MLTAACGTTVQSPLGGAPPGSGLQAPGGAPADVPGSAGAAPQPAGADVPGSPGTGGRPRSSAGTGGATSGVDAGGRSAGVPIGPGVTATSFAIGILYCNDCAAGNAAIGAAGEDPGDTRRYYQAALDDVNSRGGVLGRKLVPVFHEGSVNDTNFDAASQAACETFTKDHKVLMMSLRGEVAYECARKAGILVLGTGDTGPTYQRFPNLFAPGLIRLERLFDVTVRSMVRAGWHKPVAPWPTGRIGLITWDDTQYRYGMTHGYLKGLHEAGLKETDVRYVAVPQNAGALAEASAAISSAVLAFRQEGIDHVFIGDGPAGVFVGTGLTLLFLQNAQSQGYFPRYGFNSYNSPDFAQHPKDQLAGMLAVDSSDGARSKDEGIPLNPVRERCFAIMRKRGLPVAENQTQNLANEACGYAWFAEAVLSRARAGTDLPHMIAAAESLGTTYRSPYSFGERIGPGQHDGAALFRMLRFNEGCDCIRYTSKPFEP
jgi:hypothetical protein